MTIFSSRLYISLLVSSLALVNRVCRLYKHIFIVMRSDIVTKWQLSRQTKLTLTALTCKTKVYTVFRDLSTLFCEDFNMDQKKYCWVGVYGVTFYFFLMKLVEGGEGANNKSKLVITREWRTAGNCVFFTLNRAFYVYFSRHLIYFLGTYKDNTLCSLNRICFSGFHN